MATTKAGPANADRLNASPRLEGFIRRILALKAREKEIDDEIAAIQAEMGMPSPWTYFVQAGRGGPVKIGMARDIEQRVAGLQTAHHETLTVIRAVPGNFEREMHRRFAALRIRGEWFKFSPEMLIAPVRSTA